jgi:hypothetical protein
MPPGTGGVAGGGRAGFGGVGAPFGDDGTTTEAVAYVKGHGGGTIAVSSQSSAAPAIIASGAKVAGIGGFSGRESDVSLAWLAQEVRSGTIRWVLGEQTGGSRFGAPGLPGDTRAGSKAAMAAVAEVCRKVSLPTASAAAGATAAGSTNSSSTAAGVAATLYDCQGRAGALASA